jgi:hypothetical protein
MPGLQHFSCKNVIWVSFKGIKIWHRIHEVYVSLRFLKSSLTRRLYSIASLTWLFSWMRVRFSWVYCYATRIKQFPVSHIESCERADSYRNWVSPFLSYFFFRDLRCTNSLVNSVLFVKQVTWLLFKIILNNPWPCIKLIRYIYNDTTKCLQTFQSILYT